MKKILLLFLIFASQNSYALESMWLDEVSKLSVDYRIVSACGSWKAEDREGYYRLVLADVYRGAGSEIYVQWISNPTQEKDAEVVKTLTFPELNNDHSQYSFQTAECKKIGKFTYIKAKASYEHDEEDLIHNISIKLIDIGKYELHDTIKKSAHR